MIFFAKTYKYVEKTYIYTLAADNISLDKTYKSVSRSVNRGKGDIEQDRKKTLLFQLAKDLPNWFFVHRFLAMVREIYTFSNERASNIR